MVQRQVPNKPSIQVDPYIKPQDLSKSLKQAICNHQDYAKNRKTPDMKKKMKRSGSIKLPDMKTLKQPIRKSLPQPGKPPPTTPKKQQPILKQPHNSPNYMKSTNSSTARKENRSQPQVTPDSKNSHRRSSASNDKPTSLKLARSLTRTPSFKQARGSNKKSCGMVLCADDDMRKVTCSSTQKDSKFPNYLELNPGGTEAERTSVEKVCPYNYCSLNGHLHDPLPPLKRFLKAKRQSLKFQRSVKLEILSPCRSKSFNLWTEDAELVCPGFKSSDKEVDSIIQGSGTDFFVEIYAKSTEPVIEATHKSLEEGCDMPTAELPGEPAELCNGEDIEECIADDFGAMEFKACCLEECMVQDTNLDGAGKESKEEETLDAFYSNSEQTFFEKDYQTSLQGIDDIYDMEFEEGQLSALVVHIESSYKPTEKLYLVNETELSESEDIPSECTLEILADDMLKELFQEETDSSDIQWNDSDSEMDCTSRIWEDFWYSNMSPDQFSLAEGALEEATPDEKDLQAATNQLPAETDPEIMMEPPGEIVEKIPDGVSCEVEKESIERIPKSAETVRDFTSGMTTEALEDEHENNSLQVNDASPSTERQIVYAQNSSNHNEAETDESHSKSQKLNTMESPQCLDDSISSLKEFVQTGAAEAVIDNEEQEANGALPYTNNTCDLPHVCFDTCQKNYTRKGNKEVHDTSNGIKWSAGCRKPTNDTEEERAFNPREPNFLPIVPDPDAEKVDLKHQPMDDRKNSEEWMLDYAIRQAVTKLAPARKRKVSLLVEAFETVAPPKYEAPRVRNTPSVFSYARTIQACS